MKILTIDDDRSATLDYQAIFQEMGLKNYKSIYSMEDAARIIAEASPDLVILDIHIEEKMGLTLLPLLRNYGIFVIVATGTLQEHFNQLHEQNNVVAFLFKPIIPINLKYEISKK